MTVPSSTGERPRQEPDDLRPRAILLCAGAVVIMLLLAALLAHLVTHGLGPATPAGAGRYLTSDPVDDIAQYQQEKRSELETGGHTDDSHFSRIPIEDAMREVAARSSQ